MVEKCFGKMDLEKTHNNCLDCNDDEKESCYDKSFDVHEGWVRIFICDDYNRGWVWMKLDK